MTVAPVCLNVEGRQKRRYPSAAAAHRDLIRSTRWRRRASWPTAYKCPACKGYHLGHPAVDL